MDRRHRVYYLVNLNQNYKRSGWWTVGWDNHGLRYETNLTLLYILMPSLKVRPINMINRSDRYFQMMISCRYRDEQRLLNALGKMSDVNYERLEG